MIERGSLLQAATATTLGRRRAILFMLGCIYFLNFLDRQIILILQEPIREEFSLSDTQLGLMTGSAFGLLYTLLGLPLARWLDKGVNRTRFVGAITVMWSAMTVICGFARSFTQLFFARIGVGMAEAGFTPAAHSLISDMYAPVDRPRAIGLFAPSVPIGGMAGLLIGGVLAQTYDWRVALFVAGTPGIAMAALFVLISREPARGRTESASLTKMPAAQLGIMQSVALLLRRPAFRHVILSTSVCAFAQAGITAWLPSFLLRAHGMQLSQVGLSLGLLTGICGVIGTFGGGWQATYMARGGDHRMLLLPMFGAIASVPLFAIAFMGTGWARVELLLAFPLILGGLWTAPSIALTQNLAPVTMRAQASSVYVIGANLIGVSTGPLAVGLASDLFATYTHSSVTGLRLALIAVAFVLLLGAVHHFLAIRYIRWEQMGVI